MSDMLSQLLRETDHVTCFQPGIGHANYNNKLVNFILYRKILLPRW